MFSFMWDWFHSTLVSLGLANKSARILFLGLDNAGKTTMLHMLRDNKLVQHKPTRNPTSEELTMGRIHFSAFDLGGHREARRLWSEYFQSVDAIVYLVDAADAQRFQESKSELDTILIDDALDLDVPIVVLGNKIDDTQAVSEGQLRLDFGLQQTTGKAKGTVVPNHIRPIEVFMCSIVQREGYGAAFEWISQYIY